MSEEVISEFRGAHRFLSNFWPAAVFYEGITYPSVEHAYQAAKAPMPAVRLQIAGLKTPDELTRFGRHCLLRADWETVKLDVMKELLILKFQQPKMRELLLATGNVELIENNTWMDVFWGVCKGKGENHLGRLLMEVRYEISCQAAP